MIVTIKEIIKSDIKNNVYYIVFDYFGRERRSYVNNNILKYLGVSSLNINDKVDVLKSFINNKEFYKIAKVIK